MLYYLYIFFIKSIINCKISSILFSPFHSPHFPRNKFQARSRNFNLIVTIIFTIQTNLRPHPLQNDQPGGGQEISKRSNGICSSSSVECRSLSVSHLFVNRFLAFQYFTIVIVDISWKTEANHWSISNEQ